MIIELRDGFRLVKFRNDKNWRLLDGDQRPFGTVNPDHVENFCKVFGSENSVKRG